MDKDLEDGLKLNRITIIGLLGISTIALFELLAFESLDNHLTLAVYSFSISIPILTSLYLLVQTSIRYKTKFERIYIIPTTLIAYLSSIIGVANIVLHISKIAGFIFIISSLLSAALWANLVDFFKKPTNNN